MKSNQKFEPKLKKETRVITINDKDVTGRKLLFKRLRPPPRVWHWRNAWRLMLRGLLWMGAIVVGLFRQRTLVRDVAPNRPPLAEHEWKATGLKSERGTGRFLA